MKWVTYKEDVMQNRLSQFMISNRKFFGFIVVYILYIVFIEIILGIGSDHDIYDKWKRKSQSEKI